MGFMKTPIIALTHVATVLVMLVLIAVAWSQPAPPPGPPRIPTDPSDRRTLTVTKGGMGLGFVTGPGLLCPDDCTEDYIVNTTTVIFASPDQGAVFTGWTGACSGTGACTILMDQARAVTATFGVVSDTLPPQAPGQPQIGTASTAPAMVTFPVTWTASLDPPSNTVVRNYTWVAGYNDDPTPDFSGSVTTNNLQLVMTYHPSGAAAAAFICVTAVDTANNSSEGACNGFTVPGSTPSQFALTVLKGGAGSGTVTGVASGNPTLSCSATCTQISQSYTADTAVTLTASAASGSTFSGWSGACTGTGNCVVTMTAAKTVTATFGLTGGGGLAEAICQNNATIRSCDNFEERALGDPTSWPATSFNRGWSWGAHISGQTSVINTEAHDGTKAHQFTLPAVTATSHQTNNNGGTTFGTSVLLSPAVPEIYVRYYNKFSSNWIHSPIGQKGWFADSINNVNRARTEFGSTAFSNRPVAQTAGDNMTSQCPNFGACIYQQNLTNRAYTPGTWQCLEYRLKMNTHANLMNGVIEGWVDGTKTMSHTAMRHANRDGDLWGKVTLSGYWNCRSNANGTQCSNGDSGNLHPLMFRWSDRLVISTQRVGC